MHEQRLARLQRAALEDVGPDGEEGFRDRRGFDRRKAGGNRQGVAFVGEAIFGVAAAGNERRDPRAERVTRRARPERGHLAGDLQAENVRCAGRRRIDALALEDVGPVDARRLDLDEDFARARDRARPGLKLENLRPAGSGREDRAHGFGQFGHGLGLARIWRFVGRPPRLSQCAGATGALTPSSAGAARNAGSSSARAQNAASRA